MTSKLKLPRAEVDLHKRRFIALSLFMEALNTVPTLGLAAIASPCESPPF